MPRKALVLENDLPAGRVISACLSAYGLETALLARGEQAVARARRLRPDVLIVGLDPGMDANALCKDLKLAPETNLVPLLRLLTPADEGIPRHGLFVQANGYMTVPFSGEQFATALATAFAWREEVRRLGTEEEIQFDLSSDTRFLGELRELLGALLPRGGLTQPDIRNLITASHELSCNAIEWGHRKRIELVVTIVYRRGTDRISLIIRDTGPGFNPSDLPHAAHDDDPIAHMVVRESLGLREGGFGIMMARGLVDELHFNATGNEVRLVKYLAPAAAGHQRTGT
jgi:anti-sigma regulatory factor (Ser/Thr protein kinase)/CheY-like chemotaxis protein